MAAELTKITIYRLENVHIRNRTSASVDFHNNLFSRYLIGLTFYSHVEKTYMTALFQ